MGWLTESQISGLLKRTNFKNSLHVSCWMHSVGLLAGVNGQHTEKAPGGEPLPGPTGKAVGVICLLTHLYRLNLVRLVITHKCPEKHEQSCCSWACGDSGLLSHCAARDAACGPPSAGRAGHSHPWKHHKLTQARSIGRASEMLSENSS